MCTFCGRVIIVTQWNETTPICAGRELFTALRRFKVPISRKEFRAVF
eukprot:SAG31_NODE_38542_length_295_cov_1.005102_1_plen_46_part_10